MTSLRDILPPDHYAIEGSEILDIELSCRFRYEFLKVYQSQICSDALTPASGATKNETEENNVEALKASRFLRDVWIPAFIKSLDNFEVRPFDSRSFTEEMHYRGINIRYLGVVHRSSTIPFIQNLSLIEMIARVCKHEFRNRLREAILHFRSVGATSIDNEMKQYAASLFGNVLGTSERAIAFFESKIKPKLFKKFQHSLSHKEFMSVHRPALFLALQHHVFLFNSSVVFFLKKPAITISIKPILYL